MPAQKPTRFLSSAPELLQLLGQQCSGDHEHQQLVSGRAAAAAIYPSALCRAMLRGIEAQRRREGEPLCFSILRMMDSDPVQPKFPPEETAAQSGIPGAVPTRLIWADETPPETLAAEKVARALAANCAKLEVSISSLSLQRFCMGSRVGSNQRQSNGGYLMNKPA